MKDQPGRKNIEVAFFLQNMLCIVLMYVPFILYNLLFRPTNALYIKNNVCTVIYNTEFIVKYIVHLLV
jgi:hypothetical protein